METLEFIRYEADFGWRTYRIHGGKYDGMVRVKVRHKVRRRGKTFVYWN